jgi:hypothetical protein
MIKTLKISVRILGIQLCSLCKSLERKFETNSLTGLKAVEEVYLEEIYKAFSHLKVKTIVQDNV